MVKQDFTFWSNQFRNSSQRIQGLVEGFTYIDDVAKCAQIYPDYWSLFKRNPSHWFTAFFSPYNGATYRLNEPEQEEKAIQTMRSHKKESLGFFQYFLIFFLRLTLFDWWLNRLSDIKYCIQTSSWWPTVRSWRAIQMLNYLWTLPKKAIFDRTSDDKLESRLYHFHQLNPSSCAARENGIQMQTRVKLNGIMNSHLKNYVNDDCSVKHPFTAQHHEGPKSRRHAETVG